MRETLFRGERLDNDEWVYGYLLNNIYGASKPVIISGSSYTDDNRVAIDDWEFILPGTVGQYTGLTDKNGKKIFEGDILHVKAGKGWTCPEGTDIYYEVVFTEFNEENNTCCEYIGYMAKRGEFNLTSICYLVNSHGAKVIGNIHDNPELLKGESND